MNKAYKFNINKEITGGGISESGHLAIIFGEDKVLSFEVGVWRARWISKINERKGLIFGRIDFEHKDHLLTRPSQEIFQELIFGKTIEYLIIKENPLDVELKLLDKNSDIIIEAFSASHFELGQLTLDPWHPLFLLSNKISFDLEKGINVDELIEY